MSNDLNKILSDIKIAVNNKRKNNKAFDVVMGKLELLLDFKDKTKKEYLIDNAWILLASYFVNKTLGYYFLCIALTDNYIEAMSVFTGSVLRLFLYPIPSIAPVPLIAGIMTFFSLKVLKLCYKRNKNVKDGIEYGSATWGSEEDIKPFINKNDDYNLILTRTERLSTALHPPKGHPELSKNKNVVIYGAPGTGKTRGYAQPNIMQMFGSYIVTDPKGTTLEKVGHLLKANGYDIRVLNLKDMTASNKYNPFHYIRTEENVLSTAQILLQIGKKVNETSQSGDEFWKNAETLMYLAYLSYIFYTCPKPENRSIFTMMEMIRESKVYEDKEDALNKVDIMFRDLEYLPKYLEDPDKVISELYPKWNVNCNDVVLNKRVKEQTRRFDNLEAQIAEVKKRYPYMEELHFVGGNGCLPVDKYREYKLAAGKTAKSILVSCAARLSPLSVGNIKYLLSADEMDFDSIGRADTKTALFIITSDTDSTFDFITTLMYYQLFTVICHTADMDYSGELPVHVHFLLDEFANIGLIPDFDKKIATIRSRNISTSIFLQAQSQLKAVYDKTWATIENCCQTMLFLGSTDLELLKVISEKMGKETVDSYTQSKTYSNQKSESVNHQKLGRELMTPDEIFKMPSNKCICLISGLKPFYSVKYDITDHKRYKYLADTSDKYFNFKGYLKNKRIQNNVENNPDVVKYM